MRDYKNIVAILLISFISIGLISYFALSHIDSTRKLSQNANKAFNYYEPLVFLDFTNEKVLKEEREKSIFYESRKIPRPPPNFKNSTKKLRSLADANIFEKVGFIDPNNDVYMDFTKAIFNCIKLYSTNIILYPYSFDYKLDNGTIKHFSQGSIISLKPSELNRYNFSLKTNNTLSIKKARAVYNADIAILSIKGEYLEEINMEYFKEYNDYCSFLNHIGKGYCQSNYQDFLNRKKENSAWAYITPVNETDIKNGVLLDQDIPRFGILIIPDFNREVYERIKSLLKDSFDQFIEYYEKGGVIISNGKSGVLLEDIGLVQKGTYDRTKLLLADNYYNGILSKGCENTYNKEYNKLDDDFEKQMICLSITDAKKSCLSEAYLTKKMDPNFKKLIDLDKDSVDLRIEDIESSLLYNLTEEEKQFLPMISVKTNKKNGKIFLNNYNPICYQNADPAKTSRLFFINTLFLALSKELHINSNVALSINSTETTLPIPAGEAGVSLAINTVIHNLDDHDFSDCKLYLFIPENIGWNELPEKCKKYDDISEIPKEVEVKRTITTSTGYVLCNLGTMTSYEKRNFNITVTIENYKATQTKYQVTILDVITYFTNKDKEIISMANYVRANCENAPTLRVSANIDPSSVYPIRGVGQYFDNVIRVENKEQSTAYDVEYTGIIPIISPLLDSDDQRSTKWNLKIYADYYNKNNFEVPFESDNATDFIVSASLQGKGVHMVSEWDGPVLPSKQLISKEVAEENKEALKKEMDLKGINQGMITINDNTEIIKQINYSKSDRFYKLASQRLMVFVDDSTPDGAKTLYENNIPNDIIDPILGDRVKRNFIFMRNDIFFYDNKNYCNPPLINEKILFSVDKLIDYENKNCVDKRGQAQSKLYKAGFFSNKDHPEIIHEPNVYTNEMFNYCNLNIIDPTNEEDIITKYGNSEYFKPVHYIVPNVVKEITSSEQIYDFVKDDGNFGHHKDYTFIKFIYVHSFNFIIESEKCLYGGRITINLDNYKINSIDDVTLAPDQIAIYKKLYIDNKIIFYFKRGLMSNEQFGKKLNLIIYIENLSAKNKNDVELEVTLEEMKYDISYYPDFERYYFISTNNVKLNYISAFSYPALEIKSYLNRTLNGYELMEPFSRYGIYSQELGHRYVYARLEAHNEKKPGLVGSGTGFSLITNLGISSIPFIEYLTVGKGQIIPGSTSTSRITWKDVWGRTWHQPIRSLFPDSVPIPPPLKNFMMTTTYKLIRNNNIIQEWPSDENIIIQLKVKLLNNYPKYFEITRCKENKIRFIPKELGEGHYRDYTEKCPEDIKDTEIPNSDKIFLREGGYASYGECYIDGKSIVGGKKVEGELLDQVKKAKFCAAYTDEDSIAKCEEELEGITTLHKMDKSFNKTNIWNYSPRVESYYPKGYIEKDMWDLTHVDYDDSNMDKAYKYHVDNLLPNYDNEINKPHNVITVPIYKGLGYSISYNKNTPVIYYHGWQRKGWWPDNLQNRDDTLLAGQETCNSITVDKERRSIENWIDSKDLVGINDTTTEYVKKLIENRNKNIYVCLFGRKRPAFSKNTQRKYYAGNVNINNVIPLFVDLEANDERLTNYNCGSEQYDDSSKLYEIDGNYLETPTSKDYLYFAASLRGHAKESFNVVLNLKKFDKVKYEGMTKIIEGGRFVYWNPVNGPNSFLTVDNPAYIVNAKRNDIELANRLIPLVVPTFNAVVYYAFSIKDENKKNKIWPFYEFYENSYGFDDVAIKVHVGGINRSKAVIQPGSTTYASIIIYNNCGYDLNMKVTAIDFEEKETIPYNANDLLYNLVHTIRKPLSYNFLNYTVEEELKPYITIVPSDHNINVAPEFFDFENINVVTIRDGFKGEYSLKITVADNFPKEYRGKPIEIKIGLNTTHFDHFPGTSTDLASIIHKYTITIPSVYIAIPFLDGEFEGKVLYTSAQAKNLQLTFSTWLDFHLVDAKYTDKETIDKLFDATDYQDSVKRMDEIWQKIDNTTKPKVQLYQKIKNITFEEKYPLFPATVRGGPDVAQMYVLFKFKINQIPCGSNNYPFNDNQIKYNDWIGKEKYSRASDPILEAQGAWIVLSYDIFKLVDKLPNGTFVYSLNQHLSHEEEGYIKIQVKLHNNGNGNSYNTSYTISLEPRFEYDSCELGTNKVEQIKDPNTNTTNVTFYLNSPLQAWGSRAFIIYLKYNKVIDSYNNLTNDEINALPKLAIASKESSTKLQLTNKGDNEVTQYIRTSLALKYQIVQKGAKVYLDLVVSGRRSNPTIEIKPRIQLENENIDNIFIDIMKSDLTEYEEKTDIAIPDKYIAENLQHVESVEDTPISKETSNKEHVILYTVYLKKSNGILTTNKISYIQKDIGLSTWEVVLIILSIVCFAFTLLFVWAGINNIKKSKSGDDALLTRVKTENMEKLLM